MDATEEARTAAKDALDNEAGSKARVTTAHALSAAMREAGHILWHVGYFIGPDRVRGTSPFGFGNDLTVGLATVLQIGAELISGAITLLDDGNRYAAMALIRQLVEVEYLAWAFAEDRDRTADTWLRSSDDERLKFWQPKHLRKSSGGRFRARDYGAHCERGGHPTPSARHFLPDHSDSEPEGWVWLELCEHGSSAWNYFVTAIATEGQTTVVADLPSVKVLTEAYENWQAVDPILGLVKQFRLQMTPS